MSPEFNDFEDFVLETMRKAKIPGASVAIIKTDEIIYSKGFGFREISSGVPATPRSLYGIGSITKSFTALAVMQLVEQGKISIDAPVDEYVPIKLSHFGEKITVHHLLTHSSGIPDLGSSSAFYSGVLGYSRSWLPVAKTDDIITFMHDANEWAVNKPGERFFYLNEGYHLLGHIVSKVSGLSYNDYVRDHILHPLGMNRSFLSKIDFDKDDDRATPYIIDKEGKHIQSVPPFRVNPAGGLISNTLDLSNYLRMCIGQGEFERTKLVSGKTFEIMTTPHIKRPDSLGAKLPFGGEFYGYGWIITPNFHGHKLVDHDGSVEVYTGYLGFVPEEQVGVVALANSVGMTAKIGLFALSALLGEDTNSLSFMRTEKILNRLAGEYESYKKTMRITVKTSGGILYTVHSDNYSEETVPFFPERLDDDYALFYTVTEGVKVTIEFRMKDHEIEMLDQRVKWMKKM